MKRAIKSKYYLMKCLGFILLFGFISLGAIGGCNNNNGNNGEQSASLLFVLTAPFGMITQLGGETGNEFEITLEGVPSVMTVFSDRPERAAGTVELQEGLDLIGFQEVPPNAALVAHETIGTAESPVFELTDPLYDQATGVLMFRGELLNPPLEFDSMDLGDVSLFIDDVDPITYKVCIIGGPHSPMGIWIPSEKDCCTVDPSLPCPS